MLRNGQREGGRERERATARKRVKEDMKEGRKGNIVWNKESLHARVKGDKGRSVRKSGE